MIIEDKGYILTDIPGLDRIVIEPDESSAFGVHVLLFRDGEAQSYGVAELGQFYRAVEQAVRLADVVASNVRETRSPDGLL